MLKKFLRLFFGDKRLVLLIICGTVAWSSTMFKSGIIYGYGMGFWGPNGHDGVWHIALAKSISRGIWDMPVFAGETIKNYHIGFDLILSAIHKLVLIPIHTLYFQIIPPVLAFLAGLGVYLFVYSWTRSKLSAFLATFFVYFGGSFGWLVTFFRNRVIDGESLFWSQQSISTLINPPFALSLLIVYFGLWSLIKGIETKDKKFLTLATFLFGILVQVKIYASFLVLFGLFITGVFKILKRNGLDILKVFLGASIISILLFPPSQKILENTLVFRPFWFLEEMMSAKDRFYWPKLASAIVNYKLAGNYFKLTFAYGLSFLIFLLGNLGTRIIGIQTFFRKIKNFKNFQDIQIFVIVVILTGIFIPTFFVQRGTPWNSIQFMYYSLSFMGILSGISIGNLIKNLNTKFLSGSLLIFVIFFTLPTSLGTLLNHYLPERPPAKISKADLEALDFLSRQPDGIVLTQPFSKELAESKKNFPPRPLYLYESTAYVSAFSGKKTYLEDEVNLEITGYNWRQRRKEVERFFSLSDYDEKIKFLQKEGITYVYVVKDLQKYFKDLGLESVKIFENSEISIYKI